jgi:hypothetical protein
MRSATAAAAADLFRGRGGARLPARRVAGVHEQAAMHCGCQRSARGGGAPARASWRQKCGAAARRAAARCHRGAAPSAVRRSVRAPGSLIWLSRSSSCALSVTARPAMPRARHTAPTSMATSLHLISRMRRQQRMRLCVRARVTCRRPATRLLERGVGGVCGATPPPRRLPSRADRQRTIQRTVRVRSTHSASTRAQRRRSAAENRACKARPTARVPCRAPWPRRRSRPRF